MTKSLILASVAALALCTAPALAQDQARIAPGAPGDAPTWVNAAKTGAGASYEAYVDGRYADGGPTGDVSRVWFSLADGVLTETMYGLIHEAQIKQLRFAVVTETGLSVEGTDTTSRTEYLHTDANGRPLSPAYRVITTDNQGRYEIEKRIYTDPDSQSLVVRTNIKAMAGRITPYLLLEPHMANTGVGDEAIAFNDYLFSSEGDANLVLLPDKPFQVVSAGFMGTSDGLTDLRDGRLDDVYFSTGEQRGNTMLTGALEPLETGGSLQRDFVIGFGPSPADAMHQAKRTYLVGLDAVLANFNGEGSAVGWEDYIASLTDLPRIAEQSTDGGKLAYASALMLKVQEDRTHAGALIASLSNPWGDTVDATNPSTGYKAVWPRDFYQVAMAMLALGDTETPLAAFRYLPQVQVRADTPGNTGATGWFLQKTWVDGTIEWVAVQLDQTAMPIMLGYKLWKAGLVSDAEMAGMYTRMIKPAADFLVEGGKLGLNWNDRTVTPPWTQQERWEEQEGYSPSTTAAVVAGLVTAAEIARASGDTASADRYLATADDYAGKIESRMFTTEGSLGDGKYFVRITRNEDPNDRAPIGEANAQQGLPEDQIVDGGFLELVRYGVRPPYASSIVATLPEYDDQTREDRLRVRYDLNGVPAWRRYGNDGYGENVETGNGYGVGGMTPGQRGRVWPFFTGERGHYDLAAVLADTSGNEGWRESSLNGIRLLYVRGMESFANGGLLLPEQVWDGVGNDTAYDYKPGQGTNSATPLAWTHAEYIKLLRSLADRKVWDRYDPVAERYSAE
ncbi:MAG: glucan 1,4-alpha-glucosidase [Brevundimonas sp.]|uniref:glucan 1,4-alpha-glucosidase n=1 Tax=Brevundimonas sp. TaxID=1871086 RepID=UPI001A2F9AFA|nr:glucan 1,4-alpha-glucosidase [Brevundimonas sp.]MBJ7446932.1 glucan 1,4-alpha-glucosidase [Brevundimonas sp.]